MALSSAFEELEVLLNEDRLRDGEQVPARRADRQVRASFSLLLVVSDLA